MAHLEVEPKPKRPYWLWALLIIIAILLGFTLFKYLSNGTAPAQMTLQPLQPLNFIYFTNHGKL